MSTSLRMTIFITVILTVWTAMHAYPLWRLLSLPPFAASGARRALLVGFVALWLAYPLGRIVDRFGPGFLALPLEVAGATWMGVLFLLVATMFLADIATGFGHIAPTWVVPARSAAACLALLLGAVGIGQGLRPPAVVSYEVSMAGLPGELDGLRVVQLSDLHLGSLLGRGWLSGRIEQVRELAPEIVVVTGDLIDSDSRRARELLPELRTLRAPLGVWAVTGNHEFYAGLDASIALLRDAGFRVLRDEAVEVRPGLVMAGVDDLTARRQFGLEGDALEAALANRPPGATILLSHTPWQVDRAAAAGCGLMLSGHTHDGQIWPFGSLVRLQYPFTGGHYEIGGMHLVVSRGTGTWGPRMRLWRRSEIVLITLRSVVSH